MPRNRRFHIARQRRLFEHVARYRMTTAGAVARVPTLPIQTIRTAKYRLGELVKAGLLARAPLYRNRSYYYLTRHGAERIAGGPAHHRPVLHGPLSEPAKVRAYAMLLFCCFATEHRIRITPEELKCELPRLYRSGMLGNYYLAGDRRDSRLIGLLRVDTARGGRWDRIVRKVRRDVYSHWRHPGFRQLAANGRFEIAVVTATGVKSRRMQRALANEHPLPAVSIRVVALPEMIHLLVPPGLPAVARSRSQFCPARGGPSRSSFPRARKNNGNKVG